MERPKAIAIIGVLLIGLFVHGMHANELGLYWDDSDIYMQGMQAAGGDTLKFVFSDTTGSWSTERPFAYFAWTIGRAAFAKSLSALHWTLVGFLALTAVLLTMIAHRLVNESWFSFSVGVVFLTYPLSPLQSIWPSTIHYLWACTLALLAMSFFLRGLKARAKNQLWWFVLVSMTYLACLLTHEVFALIPPAFVALHMWVNGRQHGPDKKWGYFHRPAVWGLGSFLTALVLYGLWRELLLPIYGNPNYRSSELILKIDVFASKFLRGVSTTFLPWNDSLLQVSRHLPPYPYILSALAVFVVVWIVIRYLWSCKTASSPVSLEERLPENGIWLRTTAVGLGLVLAALGPMTLSPAGFGTIIGTSFTSRANFVIIPGVALALPGLLRLWVSLYDRFPAAASLMVLCLVAAIGLTSTVFDGSLWFRPSVFGSYSQIHRAVAFAYLAGVVLITLLVVFFLIDRMRKSVGFPSNLKMEPVRAAVRGHFAAGTVACVALIGTLLNFSVKEEFITDWKRHKTMLKQLQTLAPALEDNTFVIVVNDHRGWSAPYTTPYELSCYLLALYDNSSIIGNEFHQLRFHRNGVESKYFRTAATWFPPGVTGLVHSHATQPVPRISYDRLLLLKFDGDTLRMLPEVEVKTEDKGLLVIRNNPGRILRVTPVNSAIWSHVLRS
jgi:hypothetical protein